MTRELIEAAKAVIADRDENGSLTTVRGIQARHDAWRPFVAAVRAAEAAPVADAERVLEAAKAAVIAIPGFKNISALSQWAVGLVADAIRPYITPAPVADTVAVPVAAIRRLKSTVSSFGVGVPDWARRAREAVDEITKLLPPPPAPEPSAELRERWLSEAMDVFHAAAGISREEFDLIEARREGYVAARRAEWAKKGGG